MKMIKTYGLIAALASFPLIAFVSNEEYIKPEVYKNNDKVLVKMQVPKTDVERALNPTKYLKLTTFKGVELDTRGNKAGISETDLCAYIPSRNEIVCSSGKIFRNVGTRESSLTGTPGNLMYENYLGFIKSTDPVEGMAGSGKRTDFCAGACKRKKD